MGRGDERVQGGRAEENSVPPHHMCVCFCLRVFGERLRETMAAARGRGRTVVREEVVLRFASGWRCVVAARARHSARAPRPPDSRPLTRARRCRGALARWRRHLDLARLGLLRFRAS